MANDAPEQEAPVEAPVVAPVAVEEPQLHERVVTTAGGNEKVITANNAEDLNSGLEAAAKEEAIASPDINNPKHGNLTHEEFQAKK